MPTAEALPLSLEECSALQTMESAEGSLDLEIVRPDRNQGCTSSSPSSPPRVDKEDITTFSTFELEEYEKRYRKHLTTFKMKDNNAKLKHRHLEIENELARRWSPEQTGNQVIQVETAERLHSKLNSANEKLEVFDLESGPAISDGQLSRSPRQKRYPTIALDCDVEDVVPSPSHKKEEVNEIQDLDNSVDAKVYCGCHQTVTSESKEGDGCFRCLSCQENLSSSPANGFTPVNSSRSNLCGFTSLNQNLGSAKRSQQAIGNTYDTALELSDDEDSKEVTAGESSSGGSSLKRKRLCNASEKPAGAKFLYPSSCDPEAVEVGYADLRHLAPSEFLNDTVIDFYMKYMQMNILEEKDRLHRFHFFSCFFYKKLTSSKAQGKDWPEKLHKWTRGINIFKKAFLFIPIHDSCHWSLAIVCFLERQRGPLILHLDSMSSTAGHSSQVIFTVLKSYLAAERRHLRQQNDTPQEINMDPSRAICKRKQVPLQDNEWDCGLFMLYYMQKFVTEVEAKGLDKLFGRDWFKPSEASDLRGTILDILESIFSEKDTQPCLVAANQVV